MACAILVPQPGIEPAPLVVKAQSPNHWTAREFPVLGLLFFFFLAVLGLRFCARAFSSCSKQGPLFIAVRGPLTIVASRCGAQAPYAQAQ